MDEEQNEFSGESTMMMVDHPHFVVEVATGRANTLCMAHGNVIPGKALVIKTLQGQEFVFLFAPEDWPRLVHVVTVGSD
jgi:hypothetical protein